MSYLLTQMFLYMLVTFLLGLLLGWVLWRYSETDNGDDADALRAENERLRKELDACANRTASLQADNDALRGELATQQTSVPPAPAAALVEVVDISQEEQSKPEGLSGPRGGVADNLQDIKGVGPKMERLLNSLGYYHFDQIAAWTSSEVAWVDNNLEGFKGRVTRDSWQDQAKAFSRS